MPFGRNSRHALHCRRSPPSLLPAFQEKSRLTEQCLSRSIWQLHWTLWTINNCSIVFSTPTYTQHSVAGSTTICGTDEPKLIFGKKNLKQKGENRSGTRRSSVSSSLKLLFSRLSNTASKHQADQVRQWHYHLRIRPVVADLINGLNIYQSLVLNYINIKILTVSTAKSTVTLFTPDTHEHHIHPLVKLADQVLPLKKKAMVFVVTLDTHLTFTQHCNNIAVIVQQCNNVLKALAGSTWGCD